MNLVAPGTRPQPHSAELEVVRTDGDSVLLRAGSDPDSGVIIVTLPEGASFVTEPVEGGACTASADGHSMTCEVPPGDSVYLTASGLTVTAPGLEIDGCGESDAGETVCAEPADLSPGALDEQIVMSDWAAVPLALALVATRWGGRRPRRLS